MNVSFCTLRNRSVRLLVTLGALSFASLVAAQNLAPNPSFETGAGAPSAWTLSGPGGWENFGRTGARCVSVVGSNFATRTWSAPVEVQTNAAYWIRFWVAGSNSVSGYCYGGLSTALRDFNRPSERWTEQAYAAWVPADGPPQVRLSSWDGRGPVYFDDVDVLPLNAVHRRFGAYVLGEGETLNAGRYTFTAPFTGFGGNVSRAIHAANTSYNTARWYFNNGSQVVYRHELAGQTFTNATVQCLIQNYNNLTTTTLIAEAGTDGITWEPVGTLAGAINRTFTLPAQIQPAAEIFVRLRSTNAGQFALSGYTFAADVPDIVTSAVGETFHLGKLNPASLAQLVEIQTTTTGRVAQLLVPNLAPTNQTIAVSALTTSGSVVREQSLLAAVAAGATNSIGIVLPTAGLGDNTATITVRDAANAILFQQAYRFTANLLTDDSFGEALPSPANCPVWTCSGSYKVGRTRGLPLATNNSVQIALARNEYEPFQLVLRPAVTLSNVFAVISDFTSVTNPAQTLAATNVTIERVEYVTITEPDPANYASVLGDHPDPLPPLTAPFVAPAGTNSPLWFTVRVPKDLPAGDYTANITLQYLGGTFTVPVQLRVFDFTLTDVTHTGTAYGISPQENWHGLNWATPQQRDQIWELYMQSMARHRMSPFIPHFYSPVKYTYNSGTDSFTYDFAAFDAAMDRYLEEFHFNSFRDITIYAELPYIPDVAQYNTQRTAITPEYRRLYLKLMPPILQHFRERGWMGIAYNDWIDEPAPAQMPLVRQGMEMVEEAGPDHLRMLATFFGPIPDFFDLVNFWVPHWDYDMYFDYLEPRRAAGDRMWYYVATSPKDPWPNNFIDQPGVSPRLRQWYAERWQLAGESYWSINHYLGMTNPWVQTMSRGGNTNIGFFNLGHGDGNLVYPPVRERPVQPEVVIAGPVNSVRYETSRDGYEDREYFWLLNRLLPLRSAQWGTNHPAVVEGNAAFAEAMGLLPWPPNYPHEAHRLEAARLRVAEAIEALDDGAPFIAKDPWNKVCRPGENQTLRVEAVGWPLPAIQWQFNGTNLPGANSARLNLTNLTIAHAGEYRVIASNPYGVVTSAVGRVTVLLTNQPPLFLAEPVSLTRAFGARAVFGGGVSSHSALTYQWLHNGVVLAGATNVSLALSNLTGSHAGTYALIAANAFGSVTSAPAQLLVQAPAGSVAPAIVVQPTNQTVSAGQTIQLSVTATGTTPLNYQWQRNGTNLPTGGNAATLSLTNIQPGQAGDYRVWIGNVAGFTTSVVATITVQTFAPFITLAPTNQTVAQGQHVQCVGAAGGTAPLAYQWLFNVTNPVSGGITPALSLSNIQPAQIGTYALRVTNAFGAVTSSPAVLQLAGMPAFTNQPPGLAVERAGTSLWLTLAPDNRARTVFVSSNLLDWSLAFTNAPSAAFERIAIPPTNQPGRFYRVMTLP